MRRNFPDFINAYYNYALDGFCPDKFHYWTGISIIAAALERKVWAIQDMTIHYPNIFTMLVAVPGDGKSTAARRGIDILLNVQHPQGKILYIPPKITDAAFHSAMKRSKTFFVGAQGYEHTSAFYYATEASNALKEIPGGGDMFPLMTEAYDCGDTMIKETKSSGREEISHPCMNVLACSTFDALKGMLTEGGIMGGFASRFLYVVHDKPLIRRPKWGKDSVERLKDPRIVLLTEDLEQIHHMTGPFTVSDDYRACFEKWFPTNDAARYSKDTEKEQTFFGRKHASVIKLSMIYSAAQSSEMILKQQHWELALDSVERLERKYDKVLAVTYDNRSQEGVNGTFYDIFKQHGGKLTEEKFRRILQRKGTAIASVKETLDYMLTKSKELETRSINGETYFCLTGKPKLDVVP